MNEDTEALKALVADATALQKQLDDGDGAYPQDYHDIFVKLEAALPSLERMLASQTQPRKEPDMRLSLPVTFLLSKGWRERCEDIMADCDALDANFKERGIIGFEGMTGGIKTVAEQLRNSILHAEQLGAIE